MNKLKGIFAVMLVFVLASTNVLIFGQTDAAPTIKSDKRAAEAEKEKIAPQVRNASEKGPEAFKPRTMSGKSKAATEIRKKKFPWLLVGGIVVAGTVAAVLLLKKKSTPSDSTPTATIKEPEMIRLPGGTFIMGSESSEADFHEERPVHQVTVSGFEIGKYEVTQEEWESVMGSNPSNFKGSRLPVEKVDWDDIQAFLQKLNTMTGKSYRLPTEAEWEYACRAGTTGDRYGSLGSIAWYIDNSGNKTHDVGGQAPNGFGLYDMLGNVFEWCSDWYGLYSAGAVTNPKGPASGDLRVMRGGTYGHYAKYARAPSRYYGVQSSKAGYIGFRLARD